MINEFLKVLMYIGIVIGGALVISTIGVSILLLGDKLLENRKKRKKKSDKAK